MPFNNKAAEKVVETEEIPTNVVEMPITEPVNADVDKSKLGYFQTGKSTDAFPAVGQVNTTKQLGVTESLGLRQGAGRSNRDFEGMEHLVEVQNFTNHHGAKYNYKVFCHTCGFTGRYETENEADSSKRKHIDRHIRH